jgi:hypothetical protein
MYGVWVDPSNGSLYLGSYGDFGAGRGFGGKKTKRREKEKKLSYLLSSLFLCETLCNLCASVVRAFIFD